MIVDADTHVLETEQTFAYFSETDKKYRPSVVRIVGERSGDIPLGEHAADLWLIDGQLYGKHNLELIEQRSNGEIVPGTLDMRNPAARLAAMDRQGVDTAVIYPSLFLVTAIADADAELALARSYNRWLADVCRADPKRFTFAALVAPRRIEASIAEMEWARRNGACSVMLRGLEGDQTPDQAELRPLLAKACDLDMPICLHIGHGSKAFRSLKVGTGRIDPFTIRAPTLMAFCAILRGDLYKTFPKLRFAFVEAGASWLPFLSVMALKARRSADKAAAAREALVARNIYITCEDHEDLPGILPFAGDDNLVIGSDFGHPGDVAESIHVQRDFKARTDIADRVKARILSDNARALYAL
ncbi:MAG: amidohydrolase family protein [Rhodospirillaceae bacterium]|nr:amidohydrolase family protein [Rhodospirillaceae bacterium]